MKKLITYLFVLALGITGLQAQDYDYDFDFDCDKKSERKRDFQNRGERMLSINGLNLGGATTLDGIRNIDQFGITATYGKFYKNTKMRGIRVNYQSLNDIATHLSGYVFKRNYTGNGRLALFSEFGVGLESNQSFISTPTVSGQQLNWYDAHADAKLGASLRLGKRLGMEVSGGVRLGTQNAFAPERVSFGTSWTSSWGISYFLN
ncbi:MAG: hypothetical protein AAFN10_06860 [Bacteroidota bacterium]